MRADPAPAQGLRLPEGLVTGEAVVLELRPASFATRALASALDLFIVMVVLIGGSIVIGGLATALDEAAGAAVGLVVVVGVLLLLPVAVETITRGRSVGKAAAGLRVVRDDGGPIRFRHALTRGLLAVVEIYLTAGSVALIASLSNPRGKRLGDLLAGTYVIRERGAALPPPPQMPPELAAWAAGVDLGRIPDRVALAARQFVARAPRLHPASRQGLGLELAAQIGAQVAPAPPAGTHPERFLAAVLAERRRRDLHRLQREETARAQRLQRRGQASWLAPTSTRLVEPTAGQAQAMHPAPPAPPATPGPPPPPGQPAQH